MFLESRISTSSCFLFFSKFQVQVETKSKLKSHISNVYENKCLKREATFDHIKSLKTHMKVAHEVSNQNCVLCDSSFETKGKLKSHLSRVHEKMTKKTTENCKFA